MEREALNSKAFGYFVDVDHPSFELPGNIPAAIEKYCEATMQGSPSTRGETVRCIYESLALKYRYVLGGIEKCTGKNYPHINVVGGGTKDGLLCRMTANACNCEVTAGPIEATAYGNAAIQLIAAGAIPDIKAARKIIAASDSVKTFVPDSFAEWDRAYERYVGFQN